MGKRILLVGATGLVGGRPCEQVDGVWWQRLARGTGGDRQGYGSGQGDADNDGSHRRREIRSFHRGALQAQRKPRLAVASCPSSEDSIATRIITA